MIEMPRAIHVSVPDLDVARAWYSQVLLTEPLVAGSDSVTYAVGFCTLTLHKVNATGQAAPAATVFWGVDDVQSEFRRINSIQYTGQATPGGTTGGPGTAVVLDPFGNPFGLMDTATETDKAAVAAREAQKAALRNVRGTVESLQHETEKENKVSRRVFAWAALALAVFVGLTWANAYFRAAPKPADVRATFGAPQK